MCQTQMSCALCGRSPRHVRDAANAARRKKTTKFTLQQRMQEACEHGREDAVRSLRSRQAFA